MFPVKDTKAAAPPGGASIAFEVEEFDPLLRWAETAPAATPGPPPAPAPAH